MNLGVIGPGFLNQVPTLNQSREGTTRQPKVQTSKELSFIPKSKTAHTQPESI